MARRQAAGQQINLKLALGIAVSFTRLEIIQIDFIRPAAIAGNPYPSRFHALACLLQIGARLQLPRLNKHDENLEPRNSEIYHIAAIGIALGSHSLHSQITQTEKVNEVTKNADGRVLTTKTTTATFNPEAHTKVVKYFDTYKKLTVFHEGSSVD